MLERVHSSKSSMIVEKLNNMRLSEAERQEALAALQAAEHVVDVFMWAGEEIHQLFARLFLKPGLGS
jgi:hypothetical protein